MKNLALDGPKLKIERATAHIADVRAHVINFLSTSPCEMFTCVGPGEGEECIKVRPITEPPAEIAVICGEIIYGLRSALDQLACALATQNGYADVSGTYFPFAGSKDEFETTSNRKKISKLSPAAVSMIDSLKPYKGGNDLLWALNKLGNTDKHQMLLPMAAANLGAQLQLTGRPLGTMEHTFKVPRSWQLLDPDATIFIYPAGMHLNGEITVLTDISFRSINSVAGQPIVAVLEQFANLIEEIIGVFQKRFFEGTL